MTTPTAPTPEDLLAHTDWLLQLARALVGDAAAPDVVQQTYEAALARPPRGFPRWRIASCRSTFAARWAAAPR